MQGSKTPSDRVVLHSTLGPTCFETAIYNKPQVIKGHPGA